MLGEVQQRESLKQIKMSKALDSRNFPPGAQKLCWLGEKSADFWHVFRPKSWLISGLLDPPFFEIEIMLDQVGTKVVHREF